MKYFHRKVIVFTSPAMILLTSLEEKRKKFMYNPFKELLLSISNYPISEQKVILESAFAEWKGDFKQTDDVTILALKLN